MGDTSAQEQTAQDNIHPMATGASSPYAQTPLPPTQQMLPTQSVSPPGSGTSPVTTITMKRIPLLALTLSLMLLGALTFLGGFLLGLWLSAPTLTQNQLLTQTQPMIAGYIPTQDSGQTTGATPSQPSSVPGFLPPIVAGTTSANGQPSGVTTAQQTPPLTGQATGATTPSSTTPVTSSTGATPSTQQMPPVPTMPQTTSPTQTSSQTTAPTSTQPSSQTAAPTSTQPSSQTAAPTSTQPSSQSPAPTSTQGAQSSTGDNYSVQLGIYASQENAQALVETLQNLNIVSEATMVKTSEGNAAYYVHSGLYTDYPTALEAASQISKQIPGAYVIKISQNNASLS